MNKALNTLLQQISKNNELSVDDPLLSAIYAAAAVESGYKVVFVTPGQQLAEDLVSWTNFFLTGTSVLFSHALLSEPPVGVYEEVMPNPAQLWNRNAVLGRLLEGRPLVLGMSLERALRKVPAPDVVMDHIITLRRGQDAAREALEKALSSAGYMRVGVVQAPGEYAIRGGIVDCFSPGVQHPLRVELFGDFIDSMRYFDPDTQYGLAQVDTAVLFPAGTFVEDPDMAAMAVERLASRRPVQLERLQNFKAMMEELDRGMAFPGIMGFEASIVGDLVPVSRYFDENTLIFIVENGELREQADSILFDVAEQFESIEHTRVQPDAVQDLYADWEGLVQGAGRVVRVLMAETPDYLKHKYPLQALRDENLDPDTRFQRVVHLINGLLSEGLRVLVVATDQAESRRVMGLLSHNFEIERARSIIMSELFSDHDGVHVATGQVDGVVYLEQSRLIVLSTSLLFGKTLRGYRRVKALKKQEVVTEFPFNKGDFVVHVKYGIGRFAGLVQTEVGGEKGEFLKLEYRDNTFLYVPVYASGDVGKYHAVKDLNLIKLDKLGGSAWSARKQKAREAAVLFALKLRRLYAIRATVRGRSFSTASEDFYRFEEAFPFEETPDQTKAVDEVLQDLAKNRPMDRLVVGDVGYGKTEVAMRAAYAVVLAGKQVAVLVPTTVLAAQHRRVFSLRFQGTGVVVESLTRLDRARQKQILEGLRDGYVDIIIGTHRLLSKDVVFKDLGLLVVDEEHRFGVKHKEKIRELAHSIDTLTLTATPIPRTLHMAFSGIRDLSIMATPPRERRAVKTIVAQSSKQLIKQAILRELDRRGQVYYLHNRIEDQEDVQAFIQALVPNARIAAINGRMPKERIETVMRQFIAKKTDILLTTTIIESGLDIPNANTMIVDRADRLGLAQLYQLRGRVGRSARQAYCYFLVPRIGNLKGQARKRLDALQRLSGLSSGFGLATADLEIRGAGNIFGAEQSGNMDLVGYGLYMRMVQDALNELNEDAASNKPCEMDIDLPALIPDDQIPDSEVRLSVYHAIASAASLMRLEELKASFIERFGSIKPATERLFQIAGLRVMATKLGIAKITKKGNKFRLSGPKDALGLIGEYAVSLMFEIGIVQENPPVMEIKISGSDPIERLSDMFTLVIEGGNPD